MILTICLVIAAVLTGVWGVCGTCLEISRGFREGLASVIVVGAVDFVAVVLWWAAFERTAAADAANWGAM